MTKRRRRQQQDQRCVVVRVDWVVYGLVAVIIVLALCSVALPGRVDIALVGSLATLLTGILGGWLAYLRLARNSKHDEE